MSENAEPVSGEENRLLDFLFFVRNGKITSQFPRDKFLVPDCAYFCQPEGTHVNTCQGKFDYQIFESFFVGKMLKIFDF